MMRTKWTIRAGILGVVVSVAVLASSTTATSAAQGGYTVSGVHASEAFCQAIAKQSELLVEYMKLMKLNPLSPDMTKRAKFYTDSKASNATVVRTAPAALASDVARAMKNSDAVIDAQLAGKAVDTTLLTSPEQLATAKRMNDYCGVKFQGSK